MSPQTRWIVLTVIVAAYSVPLTYIFYNRKKAEVKTRSPYITLAAITFLCGDTIMNTFIFSLRPNSQEKAKVVCGLGLICTSFFFAGAMACYYLRMFRVYKFFVLYERYLSHRENEAVRS
jgi:quinol-cytochrome oxidoreductase complex cytochrome b subunit